MGDGLTRFQRYYRKNRKKILAKMRVHRIANLDMYARNQRRYRGTPEATRPRPAFCEACGGPPGIRKRPVIDHDHLTGAFRGWLCHNCNLALGLLRDSRANILDLARYLRVSMP